jgi:murein L,D-transpeptidase YafK
MPAALLLAASVLLTAADTSRAPAAPVPTPRHVTPAPASALPVVADSVVLVKSTRTLTLYHRGAPVRIYFVALGLSPVGDKQQQGDNRTPEGRFRIEGRNPGSKFHLALRVSYPEPHHVARARSAGTDPGGDIMIHGLPREFAGQGASHRSRDWTNGCIAVTNEEIEEIWRAVPDGTPFDIRP